jgi:curli biogenesis system outer membrane secretion channel CsgG
MRQLWGSVLSAAVLTAAAAAGAGETVQAPCAVVGFVNNIDNKEWHDGRVGMGVRAMLSQALFNTGLFTLAEEKPEIKARLEELAGAVWARENGDSVMAAASAEMKTAGAQFIASGKVFHFGRPRTRASVGPAHFASDEVEIKIEVTLTDAGSGRKISAIGSGRAKTTATSGLFTFHDEHLDADQSMVGTATRKAIADAVEEIAKKYRKVYKIK